MMMMRLKWPKEHKQTNKKLATEVHVNARKHTRQDLRGLCFTMVILHEQAGTYEYVCVVPQSGDAVEGVRPRVAATKHLPVLPGGI